MAPQPEETPVLEVIINILDNKLAGIACSQDLPLESFAKKHVEADTARKARSLISNVISLCSGVSSYFSQRLGCEYVGKIFRLKWYSGDAKRSTHYTAVAFADKGIVELLSIISNCFKSVVNRCDPDFVHLEFTQTDDKIWEILAEISEVFSAMLAEAQQITAPKQVPSETSAPKEASTSAPEKSLYETVNAFVFINPKGLSIIHSRPQFTGNYKVNGFDGFQACFDAIIVSQFTSSSNGYKKLETYLPVEPFKGKTENDTVELIFDKKDTYRDSMSFFPKEDQSGKVKFIVTCKQLESKYHGLGKFEDALYKMCMSFGGVRGLSDDYRDYMPLSERSQMYIIYLNYETYAQSIGKSIENPTKFSYANSYVDLITVDIGFYKNKRLC